MPRMGFEPTLCEWRAHRLVHSAMAWIGPMHRLFCIVIIFISENDHVRMREGQKVCRNKNLAYEKRVMFLHRRSVLFAKSTT